MRIKAIFCTLALAAAIGIARADTPAADPGFCYVDINNDGLYSASTGDVGLGSTPSVDINALIVNDGSFDTQRSEGAYRARCRAVSLVVPASQHLILTVPIRLHAGAHLLVHGALQAPSICLSACGNVDLTRSTLDFDYHLTGWAGCTLNMTGTTATGFGDTSVIWMGACGTVVGFQEGGYVPALIAFERITVAANCAVSLDGAAFMTFNPTGGIEIGARGPVTATNYCSFLSGGFAEAVSTCRDLSLKTAAVAGSSIDICAGDSAYLQDASLQSAGCISISACDGIAANSFATAFNGGSIDMLANSDINVSGASLAAGAGAFSLRSIYGAAIADGASVQGAAGITLRGQDGVSAVKATLQGDRFVKLTADCGGIAAGDSRINPLTASSPSMYINATAPSHISLAAAVWTAPASIVINSRKGNVNASRASLSATNPAAWLALTAGGGTIDLRGAAVVGAAVYGPRNVLVLFP